MRDWAAIRAERRSVPCGGGGAKVVGRDTTVAERDRVLMGDFDDKLDAERRLTALEPV